MMRELKSNDFNGSQTTSHRYFYPSPTNVSHYLSSRIHTNQCQRQILRYSQENNKVNQKSSGGFRKIL